MSDLIEFGFSDHVEEQLLYFDDNGNLEIERTLQGNKATNKSYDFTRDREQFMIEEEGDQDDRASSMNSSAMDGGTSYYGGATSYKDHSIIRGDSGNDPYADSANASNFRQNLEGSAKKQPAQNEVVESIVLPMFGINESHSEV